MCHVVSLLPLVVCCGSLKVQADQCDESSTQLPLCSMPLLPPLGQGAHGREGKGCESSRVVKTLCKRPCVGHAPVVTHITLHHTTPAAPFAPFHSLLPRFPTLLCHGVPPLHSEITPCLDPSSCKPSPLHTSSLHLQAMARCHRIGQAKEVTVYRLLTRDTYEAQLFATASRKWVAHAAHQAWKHQPTSVTHRQSLTCQGCRAACLHTAARAEHCIRPGQARICTCALHRPLTSTFWPSGPNETLAIWGSIGTVLQESLGSSRSWPSDPNETWALVLTHQPCPHPILIK